MIAIYSVTNNSTRTKGLSNGLFTRYKIPNQEKVLAMQPIYYVSAGLKILNRGGGWWIAKLDGDKLKRALDNLLLYEDYRCFTTEKEAQDLVKKLTEQKD